MIDNKHSLRDLALEAGYPTQEEFAKAARISRIPLSAIEMKRPISEKHAILILAALRRGGIKVGMNEIDWRVKQESRLAAWRVQAGYRTQSGFAKAAGVSLASVQAVEARRGISRRTALLIAKALQARGAKVSAQEVLEAARQKT